MATTKISSTKSTSRAINYAEKRAEEKSALNCDIDYAKSSFKATREMYGKTDGNEGHVVIQSFKPNEVTPEQCNQLGLELAEKIAPNHQVAVYTHNDTDHVHNHIVINSIDLETGKKFNNNKKALHDIRQANDEVCQSHNLSIPNRQAQIRYTQAEKAIVFDKEEYSWKDELRELIENAKAHTSNLETFSEHLEEKGVEVKLRGETISYKPENANKWVRGRTLGSDYEKGAIDYEHERHQEQQREPEYAEGFKVNWDAVEQHTKQLEKRRIERTQKTKQANSKVFGRDTRESENERERTRSNHIKIERDDEGLSR